MPFGAPSYTVPKSACAVRVAPIVATQVADAAATGSASTGVFQMLSGGNIGQPAIVGGAAAPTRASASSATAATRAIARARPPAAAPTSAPLGAADQAQLRGRREELRHGDA